MFMNTCAPRVAAADGAGAGAAISRDSMAKFTESDECADAGLSVLTMVSSGVPSSGEALNWQFDRTRVRWETDRW